MSVACILLAQPFQGTPRPTINVPAPNKRTGPTLNRTGLFLRKNRPTMKRAGKAKPAYNKAYRAIPIFVLVYVCLRKFCPCQFVFILYRVLCCNALTWSPQLCRALLLLVASRCVLFFSCLGLPCVFRRFWLTVPPLQHVEPFCFAICRSVLPLPLLVPSIASLY